MSPGYQTKQRERICSCLESHRDQSLNAREILKLCEDAGVPVSLPTIYRQLDSLVRDRRVRKIVSDDRGGIRYQYIDPALPPDDDFFLKCDSCGEISSAGCGLLLGMAEHMADEHGFKIDTVRSVLYGRCSKCR